MDDFIFRALLGGIGVALISAPLGAFVVWRRMSYFGSTLSHSALLGVALGFLLGASLNLAVIVVCVGIALLLGLLQQQRQLASDTLLGILAHSSLAIGLVALAFIEGLRVDLMAYLFGDILAITVNDLWWIWLGGGLALAALAAIWRPLLAITVHEDLARVEGIPVRWVSTLFMLMIALVIAVAMKIVGILLITSLLIIPAATARRLSSTPEQMAVIAAVIGVLSVAGGLYASLLWDTPAGPSIVVVATVVFVAVYAVPVRREG